MFTIQLLPCCKTFLRPSKDYDACDLLLALAFNMKNQGFSTSLLLYGGSVDVEQL
jgi:hypothetical protein